MNELKVFSFNSNQVRTIQQDGEPWFVLKDVCAALGISNTADVYNRLDPDEKGVDSIDTLGGSQEMNVVNESGLYNVILRSDKPQAKPFRKWVTSEVLPSIRRHGAYMTPEALEEAIINPDYLLSIVTALKEETDKRKALEATNLNLETKICNDKPKVLFADAVEASQTSILVGELAKILRQNGIDMGQNRLFKWLRGHGYLISRNGTDYNMPTQRSMELGLFEIKERTINDPSGTVRITKTPKLTGKGQQFFINKLMS